MKKLKFRGVGTYNPADNSFGFEPFNEGPSTQTDVKTCAGGGKRWITTGATPSMMFTLKSKASSADPYSELVAQFNALTRDLKPKKSVTLPDSLRVVKEQGLECWLDEEKGEVTFTGTIDLSRHSLDWQAEVLRQVQMVVRRLPASDKFNKVINNIKKGGNV
ncbi:MAG: hypothetical protein Q4E32_03185 [Bacteroidales bacterium]|nr:hypothetical protein [Bacteroidales bacterium]